MHTRARRSAQLIQASMFSCKAEDGEGTGVCDVWLSFITDAINFAVTEAIGNTIFSIAIMRMYTSIVTVLLIELHSRSACSTILILYRI